MQEKGILMVTSVAVCERKPQEDEVLLTCLDHQTNRTRILVELLLDELKQVRVTGDAQTRAKAARLLAMVCHEVDSLSDRLPEGRTLGEQAPQLLKLIHKLRNELETVGEGLFSSSFNSHFIEAFHKEISQLCANEGKVRTN
jgi:hypothetical protein